MKSTRFPFQGPKSKYFRGDSVLPSGLALKSLVAPVIAAEAPYLKTNVK